MKKAFILILLFIFTGKAYAASTQGLQFDEKSVEIFLKVLESEYKARGNELKKNGKQEDAEIFYKKASLVKKRDATYFNESTFKLSKDKRYEAELARLFFDKLRSNTETFKYFPESLARMQSYYDCMLFEFSYEDAGSLPHHACTDAFDSIQKSFQRTGFTKKIKYLDEYKNRETFIIYFDVNSSTITQSEQKSIADAVARVKIFKHASYQVNITGLADKTGNAKANLELSERRSKAVQAALVARGVPSNKISTNALGDAFTRVDTQKSERQNRRVVIDILY